jgi:hypothetical protein
MRQLALQTGRSWVFRFQLGAEAFNLVRMVLGSGQILDASPVVPGWQVSLDEVFPEE